MRRLIVTFLTSVLAVNPAFAGSQPQPVIGQAAGNPAGVINALGMAQLLGSPYRQPNKNDDVTRGIYPSMVWRSNDETWVNISNGVGQAMWQKQTSVPLPGDVIGLYVSAAAVNAAGSGYAANDTITLQGGVVIKVLTVSAGAISTISVITPNMYGVCSPTTTAAPQLATSGSGSGATFNLTVAYPTIYAVRRVSSCYTGPIVNVQNSVTKQTKDIAYLSDNAMDAATALAFGSSGQPMETYANYNDASVAGIDIWYDQGGAGNNATQATISQQPVLFGGRKIGNSVAVLFNAQGQVAGGLPYPSATSLIIPSGVSFTTTNAAVFVAGGGIGGTEGFVQLTPVGATGSHYYGIRASSASGCVNITSAGTGDANGVSAPTTSTPQVMGCIWRGGSLVQDHTYSPSPATQAQISGYTFPSSHTVTVTAGSNCTVPITHSVTYTSTPGDTFSTALQGLIAAIHADSVFAAAGITAQLSTVASFGLHIFQPVGSACAISTSATGDTFAVNADVAGAGWPVQGGNLGMAFSTTSGNAYEGFVAIVPWAVTNAQAQQLRAAIHHHFDFDGHPGVNLLIVSASNASGYFTPFLQDMVSDILPLLGRRDVAVVNLSVAGQSIVTIDGSWTGDYVRTLRQMTTGTPNNNIVLIFGEYNSLGSVGSAPALYAAAQDIAAKAHAAGWKAICAPEAMKNATATQLANNAAYDALLRATPGNCDLIVDPTTIPVFNNTAGPWSWPFFTKVAAGNHLSALGNTVISSLFAEAIRGMIQ